MDWSTTAWSSPYCCAPYTRPPTGSDHRLQPYATTDLDGIHGGQIFRADVATFVVARTSGDEWLSTTPLITNPVDE